MGSLPLRANTQPEAQGQAHTAEAAAEAPKLDVAHLLFEHILDSHDWHLLDWPDGTDAQGRTRFVPVSLPLPYILYSSSRGLEAFFAPHHAQGHEAHHKKGHDGHAGHRDHARHHDTAGHQVGRDAHAGHVDPLAAHGYQIVEKQIQTLGGEPVWDFSITKTVLQIMIICLLLLLVFTAVARAYTRRPGQAPRGLQGFFEPIIVFVRDEIAKPNLHGKHDRYVPYLLTLFFFIFFSNLLGLTPLNSNIAGNISVTVALAVLTFFMVQLSGSRDYWQHIFWTPGVPHMLRIIMLPVEIIGIFTKPFSLTVRLFANITGGHFMVLALVSLIFILGENGTQPGAAYTIAPLSLAFGTFIFCLELLVALIQAYIFTLLTAVFTGMAMETHDHHEDAGAAAH